MTQAFNEGVRHVEPTLASPMRLLFVSNFFPPEVNGGYEIYCHKVATSLVKRGHKVAVLTTRINGLETTEVLDGVLVVRQLHRQTEGGVLDTTLRYFRERKRLERENRRSVEHLIGTFEPEAALLWGMWNISKSVPYAIEQLMGDRAAYYFCDYWPTLSNAYLQNVEAPPRRAWAAWPKLALASVMRSSMTAEDGYRLSFPNPIAVSHVLGAHLASELKLPEFDVIHGGVDFRPFAETSLRSSNLRGRERIAILYIGRLHPDKGVHTLIEAMQLVESRSGSGTSSLDIIGDGDPGYIARLTRLAEDQVRSGSVRFLPAVDHDQVPKVLSEYDVFVLPSIWEEPFARAVLEGMASGMVVIGSNTGGTQEVLTDRENGLIFPSGNASALADRIELVIRDADLRLSLSREARLKVAEGFTLEHMVERFEQKLRSLVGKVELS